MKGKKLTPCKAIKEYCQRMCNGKNCIENDCPLFPYHLGHNPSRRGIGRISLPNDKNGKTGQFKPSQDGKNKIQRIITDGKIEIIIKRVKK